MDRRRRGTRGETSPGPTRPAARSRFTASPPSTAESMNAYALAGGSPVVVDDLSSESRFSDAFLAGHGVTSAMVVPIVVRDEPVGAVGGVLDPGPPIRARGRPGGRGDRATAVDEGLPCRGSGTGRRRASAEPGRLGGDSIRERRAARRGRGFSEGRRNWRRRADFGGNRRRSERLPFQHWQRIAPIYGGVLPTRSQFYKVECCDLSNGGISFYVTSRPRFDQTRGRPGHAAGGTILHRPGGPHHTPNPR